MNAKLWLLTYLCLFNQVALDLHNKFIIDVPTVVGVSKKLFFLNTLKIKA